MTSRKNWVSKTRLAWLCSLALYLLCAGLLFWRMPSPQRTEVPVDIEWIEVAGGNGSSGPLGGPGSPGSSVPLNGAASSQQPSPKKPTVTQILKAPVTGLRLSQTPSDPVLESLKTLSVNRSSDPASRGSAPSNPNDGSASQTLNGDLGSGEGDPFAGPITSLETALELDPFYKALAESLGPRLTYPEDLVLQYIDGSVNVELEVNGQGQIEGDSIKFRGDHPALEAYVVATLYEVLKDPLPHRQWVARTRIPVKFEFRFVRLMPESQMERTQLAIAGHHLQFNRYAYLRPQILGQKVERFLEKYWPPVIIGPGLVAIDFVRLYEMIKAHHEPDKHELREFRIKTLQEVRRKNIERIQESKGTTDQSRPN